MRNTLIAILLVLVAVLPIGGGLVSIGLSVDDMRDADEHTLQWSQLVAVPTDLEVYNRYIIKVATDLDNEDAKNAAAWAANDGHRLLVSEVTLDTNGMVDMHYHS